MSGWQTSTITVWGREMTHRRSFTRRGSRLGGRCAKTFFGQDETANHQFVATRDMLRSNPAAQSRIRRNRPGFKPSNPRA